MKSRTGKKIEKWITSILKHFISMANSENSKNENMTGTNTFKNQNSFIKIMKLCVCLSSMDFDDFCFGCALFGVRF